MAAVAVPATTAPIPRLLVQSQPPASASPSELAGRIGGGPAPPPAPSPPRPLFERPKPASPFDAAARPPWCEGCGIFVPARRRLCDGCTRLMRTGGLITIDELRAEVRRREARERAMEWILGGSRRWLSFERVLVPKILDAARHVVQRTPGSSGRAIYSEAPSIVATLLYLAGSAQWYGLTADQAEAAIAAKYVELRSRGAVLRVPVHDRLLDVWRRHLDARDFDGPFLFRNGQPPFDGRSAGKRNEREVHQVLEGRRSSPGTDSVRRRLRELHGVDELLAPARFRKTFLDAAAAAGLEGAPAWLPLHVAYRGRLVASQRSVEDVLAAQREISAVDVIGESRVRRGPLESLKP